MRALLVVPFFGLLVFLAVLPVASAATGHPSTCADVTTQATPSTLGSRYWFVTDATDSQPSTSSGCAGAAQALRERAGSNTQSITLRCYEATTGVSPPAAPTTVTVYAQSDNQNSGSPATSPIWSATLASGSCTGSSTATFFCTTNGLSGGTARMGLVRFIVRAVRTGGGSYDVNSDTGGVGAGFTEGSGVFRCQPDASAFTDATFRTLFVGGDTINPTLTAAVDYQALSLGNMNVFCGGVAHNAGSVTFSSDTSSTSITVQGTTTSWPDDCTVLMNMTITRASAIPTYVPSGSVIYATWNSSPCGSCGTVKNVGGNNVALEKNQGTVDRTLTPNSCTGFNPIVNRGDTQNFRCLWENARSVGDASGTPFRAYATNGGFRDVAGFASVDGAMDQGGVLSFGSWANWTGTVKTTAPTTSGLAYHQQVDDFAPGHVGDDNFLWNWGNTTGEFDVSATGTFDGINISKTSGGTNASQFTIGNDLEFAKAKGLRNASADFVVGVTVSCQRTRPDTTLEPAVSMGATDASGNSPEQQFPVVAPAGTWSMTCSAAWSGNTATYRISFFHVSPFTGNLQAPILWNVTRETNGTMRLNMTACLREYDQASDSVLRVAPDDVVRLTVEAYNATTDLHDRLLQNRSVMQNEDGGVATCFRHGFWANESDLAAGAFAYVTMNFTGNPFMGSQAYILVSNFTGNFSGNFTGNATILDASGMLTLSTALDSYLPILLWGGLFIYWLWFAAWLPATTALMALAVSAVLPLAVGSPQPWTFAASLILNVLGIALHALVSKGIIPTPWGRSRD